MFDDSDEEDVAIEDVAGKGYSHQPLALFLILLIQTDVSDWH